MTEVRYKEVAVYFNICKTCGEEFIVPNKGFSQKICDQCQKKAAVARAKKELERFIGATIINIEPVHRSWGGISASELEYIEVKTADGKCVRFSPCDDDGERYIEWEERSIS